MLFGKKKKDKEVKKEEKKVVGKEVKEVEKTVKKVKEEVKEKVASKPVKKSEKDNKNPGSSEAQISNLTARIDTLAEHLKKIKKDKQSTRALLQMVADRRRIVKYLP